LSKPASHVGYVHERSNKEMTFIRFTEEAYRGAVFPGDSRVMKVSYYVDQRLFERRSQVFAQAITARAYAEDKVAAAEVKKTVSEMQQF